MKRWLRILAQSLSLFFAVGLALTFITPLPPTSAEGPPSYYTDDETFEQLSSAAQNLLELKYGKKASIAPAATAKATTPSPGAPFIIPQAVIDNIFVNNPISDTTAQDTQSETAIVLAGGSTVVASWNDSGSLLGGAQKFTGFGRSTTGGVTWTDGGTLPTNANGDSGDPVLAYGNALGRTYLSTLSFSGSGIRIFRSNDGGNSWLAPVEGAPGFGGSDFIDKEWIAVDNFAGAGNGNVYHIFRNFPGGGGGSQLGGIYFTRSTDGGATFGPSPGTLIVAEGATNVQGAFVAVGPDHSVYAFWYDQNLTPRQIRVRRSTDLGVSFGAPNTVASLTGTATNGNLGLNGGFRTSSFPHATVNPVSGHLYVVYNDDAPGAADQADVFFTMSTNNGATWSAPVRVNDDTTTSDQFIPTLAVTPDGTRLAITFYDRRLDPSDNLIDRFGVIGTIAGGTVSFGPNFRITTASFPVVIGVDPVVNTVYMSDYEMMAADNNFFYHVWSDNRDPSIAVPARNNANVRFGRFPVTGPGAMLALVSASLAPGAGNGNGAIDLNECNTLNVSLKNMGTGPATGIASTLSTSTPGVTVAHANSPYADIVPGAIVTNTFLFKASTLPTFTLGSNIAFNLAATTIGDGAFAFPFQMPSGFVGTPVRFDNNTPLNIVDVSTVTSTLAVSGITSPVAVVTVSLHLTHTFDEDLDIFLVGPDGTTVELTSDNGGSGDNYGSACSPDSSRTVFDDTAATAITAGA
ncbi:MAG: proprotein convertase P-domain-containing protein, partial [Chloroflexi bacterium]|nr:proprotein convertase P-domain-containing protein [Chloroflexota bacterium]